MRDLNLEEVIVVSGATKLIELLDLRGLTNVFPIIRPHGLKGKMECYHPHCQNCGGHCRCNECHSLDIAEQDFFVSN